MGRVKETEAPDDGKMRRVNVKKKKSKGCMFLGRKRSRRRKSGRSFQARNSKKERKKRSCRHVKRRRGRVREEAEE